MCVRVGCVCVRAVSKCMHVYMCVCVCAGCVYVERIQWSSQVTDATTVVSL